MLTRKHFEDLAFIAAEHPEAQRDIMEFAQRFGRNFKPHLFEGRVGQIRAAQRGMKVLNEHRTMFAVARNKWEAE